MKGNRYKNYKPTMNSQPKYFVMITSSSKGLTRAFTKAEFSRCGSDQWIRVVRTQLGARKVSKYLRIKHWKP